MIKVESDYALCPKFEKAFSILGKKWNGLIIDVLLEDGKQRFVELANCLQRKQSLLLDAKRYCS